MYNANTRLTYATHENESLYSGKESSWNGSEAGLFIDYHGHDSGFALLDSNRSALPLGGDGPQRKIGTCAA